MFLTGVIIASGGKPCVVEDAVSFLLGIENIDLPAFKLVDDVMEMGFEFIAGANFLMNFVAHAVNQTEYK